MKVDQLIKELQELSKDNYDVVLINGENGQMPVHVVALGDDYWYGDNRKVIILGAAE